MNAPNSGSEFAIDETTPFAGEKIAISPADDFPRLTARTRRSRRAFWISVAFLMILLCVKFALGSNAGLSRPGRLEILCLILIYLNLLVLLSAVGYYDRWAKRLQLRMEVRRAIEEHPGLPPDAVALAAAKRYQWKVACGSFGMLATFLALQAALLTFPNSIRGFEVPLGICTLFVLWTALRFLVAICRFMRFATIEARSQ